MINGVGCGESQCREINLAMATSTAGPASQQLSASSVTVSRPPGTSTATTPASRPAARSATAATAHAPEPPGLGLRRPTLVDPHQYVQISTGHRVAGCDELHINPGRKDRRIKDR